MKVKCKYKVIVNDWNSNNFYDEWRLGTFDIGGIPNILQELSCVIRDELKKSEDLSNKVFYDIDVYEDTEEPMIEVLEVI